MDIILKYFPDLNEEQIELFTRLQPLYKEWNDKINVISRKDIDNLYERHVLHSLSIAKLIKFRSNSDILDLGTGGGFPGIPLAIMFPNVNFHLVDGTKKKILVVQEIADALGLKNVKAEAIRAEDIRKKRYDFVLARAVTRLDKLVYWMRRVIKREHRHPVPNGLLTLKGGQIEQEIKDLEKGEYSEVNYLSELYEEEMFKEKYIVYVQG